MSTRVTSVFIGNKEPVLNIPPPLARTSWRQVLNYLVIIALFMATLRCKIISVSVCVAMRLASSPKCTSHPS